MLLSNKHMYISTCFGKQQYTYRKIVVRAFTQAANQNCAFIRFLNIAEDFCALGFAQDNQERLHNRK